MNAADMNRIKITSLARRLTQTAARRIPSLWLCQAMVALLLLTACVRDDFDDLPKPPVGTAVSFRAETLDEFATRATGSTTRSAGYTTTGTYAIGSMGIYGGYTSAAWDGNASPKNFFDNLPVSRTSDTSSWTYGDEKMWPGSGYLTFFAYAPHSDNAIYGTNKPIITATTGTPTLAYTIAPTHDKQVDLLVSTPVKDQTKRDYVTIPLRHALSKIAFSARVANDPAAGTTYRVTQIKLDKLYNSGTIPMDGQNRTWTPTSGLDGTYVQATLNGGLKPLLPLTSVYQSITPTNGHLFLLPQTLAEGAPAVGATVSITYVTQVGTGPEETKTFDLELSRAITAFNPGMAYNLMFTIDNGVTFIVAPTPWDKTDVEVDIKNRILNVSRIEASVYPGVPTRIFFWSNQPKDEVYVRTNGNLNSDTPNPKQPVGTEYTVDDVFQTLSGKAAANLHYPGFDGVTTASGEGYIDVWHVANTTTPFNPVLTDGDKRHIWLNAAGLTRNILLNSVVGISPLSQPYVGTFHRWNETGERIITWGAPSDWTATIMDPGTFGADILIDNLPSPFMATGQLYSDGNVGDPEAAQLASTATGPVTGKGRVYFRVGWKSRLASATTAPRYGRIQVTGTNVGGSGVNAVTLYIRQGELADYVYDPNYGGANARPYAVKWSPYNLTATGLTGTTESVQIAANRSNARFTDYPTQAGGMFQWANNMANPRYAYHPTVPATTTPTGWNSTRLNQIYWASLMTTHESCPPGYRRPTDGSITTPTDNNVRSISELRQSLFLTPKDGIGSVAGVTGTTATWGFYADGFFDRRKIVNAIGSVDPEPWTAVLPTTAEVGYIGRIFYTNAAQQWRSIFFPAAGSRYGNDGKIHNPGKFASYYTATAAYFSATQYPVFLLAKSDGEYPNRGSDTPTGLPIRCVRDIGFVTDLNPDTEVLVPTALTFNAPDPDIKAATVEKYSSYIIAAISAMANPAPKAYNIRARVTFTGTVTSTGITANIDGLLDHAYVASGSTVTYDFSHASLTWAAGKRIQIGVTTANWEYQINDSSTWTTGGFGIAATLNAKGKIVVRKK